MAGAGPSSLGQVLVDGQRHERQDAVGDRDVQASALPGHGPGGQGSADGGHRLEAAPGAVGHRGSGQGRPAVAVASRAVEVAADGQVVQVVAGPASTGAALAVAGGGAVDDPRIPVPDGLVADAQPVHHPRSETLDDHVGHGG